MATVQKERWWRLCLHGFRYFTPNCVASKLSVCHWHGGLSSQCRERKIPARDCIVEGRRISSMQPREATRRHVAAILSFQSHNLQLLLYTESCVSVLSSTFASANRAICLYLLNHDQ